MFKKITEIYRQIAYRQETGFMLNHITLRVENEELREKADKTTLEIRNGFLFMSCIGLPILETPIIALRQGRYALVFFVYALQIVIFFGNKLLLRRGIKSFDSWQTFSVYCIHALLYTISAFNYYDKNLAV